MICGKLRGLILTTHPSPDGLNKALDRGEKGLEFHRKKNDIHHEKMRAAWTNYSSP
jgi:hypothetical protein